MTDSVLLDRIDRHILGVIRRRRTPLSPTVRPFRAVPQALQERVQTLDAAALAPDRMVFAEASVAIRCRKREPPCCDGGGPHPDGTREGRNGAAARYPSGLIGLGQWARVSGRNRQRGQAGIHMASC